MFARHHPSEQLLRLARQQAGVLSIEQILGHGTGRSALDRIVGDGRWRRMTPGLYLTRDADPDWPARVWAGSLLGGDAARIGGLAALRLWGVEPDEPEEIVVLVPHPQRPLSRGGWRFIRERVGVRDPRSHGSPSRIGLADALLDQCGESEQDAAVDIVLRAVQSRRISVRALARAVEGRRRLRHRRLLLDLVADAAEGAETPLELRYFRHVERAHGLPRGHRQHVARRSRHIRDVRYDAHALLVELDGRLGHEGMGRFRDMNRDNLALLAGEHTLRYGWPDVTGRPCEVARQVATALAQHGWRGPFGSCPVCIRVPAEDWGS